MPERRNNKTEARKQSFIYLYFVCLTKPRLEGLNLLYDTIFARSSHCLVLLYAVLVIPHFSDIRVKFLTAKGNCKKSYHKNEKTVLLVKEQFSFSNLIITFRLVSKFL